MTTIRITAKGKSIDPDFCIKIEKAFYSVFFFELESRFFNIGVSTCVLEIPDKDHPTWFASRDFPNTVRPQKMSRGNITRFASVLTGKREQEVFVSYDRWRKEYQFSV